MSLWEYKVITSGKGGFATPAMMEKFLNDLGRDEWEIVCFQTAPENFLAFTGLARRSTQRDWTLEDAAAAAAKAEAEKLRAEFEAKFKAANQPVGISAEERTPSFLEEKAAPDDGFRKPVDTSRDDEPEAADDEKDDWDKLTAAEEDELPTFFEAIKPHMRRNQRGPGMSVGVDYLAKKWDQSEDDLKNALLECGFVMPVDEDSKAEYLEYDGDLYWLNINRRGELWINTKEKPRPVFRSVKAQKIVIEDEAPKKQQAEVSEAKSESGDRKPEAGEKPEETATQGEGGEAQAQSSKSQAPAAPLPEGAELLRKIRPHMRRNRRGPGGSGSTNFLARALRTNEADLKAGFVALGLTLPTTPNDKAVYTEIGNEVWWLNLDSRGGLWINGREKRAGESLAADAGGDSPTEQPATAEGSASPATAAGVPTPDVTPSAEPAASGGGETAASAPSVDASERAREVAPMPADPAASTPSAAPSAETAPVDNGVLAGVRPLLKETKTGATATKLERVAEELGKSVDDTIGMLVGAGLKVPDKPREKPVYVEHAGEIFWLSKNARGELWVNAKAAKLADKSTDEADEDEGEEADDAAEGGEATSGASEGDAEKKPRRGRSRSRKAE